MQIACNKTICITNKIQHKQKKKQKAWDYKMINKIPIS